MDGYGHNSELPDSLNEKIENSMIFDGLRNNKGEEKGGTGIWAPVEPGHGYGFSTNGSINKLSPRFGPELSFANEIKNYGKNIAIIKYSFGGTALYPGAGYGNWKPDVALKNHFDNALASIDNALSVTDINNDGRLDKLIPAGILWMQGESDAEHSLQSSESYLQNLTNLMSLFRAALRNERLPIIIGKINDSYMAPGNIPTQPFIEIVNQAQKDFTDMDPCAYFMQETELYKFSSDAWHYDSDGYIKMGIDFANSIIKLERDCN